MNRIINFDDEKSTLELVVAGKHFEIRRVVSGVRDQYALFVQKTMAYEMRMKDAVEKLTRGEFVENFSAEQITAEAIEWKANQLEKLLSMILVSNGIAFDADWWADNAEYNDMIKFILECINKDDKKKAENPAV